MTLFLYPETCRKEKDDSLLSVGNYVKLFPDKNVDKSLSKYIDYTDKPNYKGAINWLTNEKGKKKPEFRKLSLIISSIEFSYSGIKCEPVTTISRWRDFLR